MALRDFFRVIRPIVGIYTELRRLNDNLESLLHNHFHAPTGKEYRALVAEAEAEVKAEEKAQQSRGVLAGIFAQQPERPQTELDLAIEQARQMKKDGLAVPDDQLLAIMEEMTQAEKALLDDPDYEY